MIKRQGRIEKRSDNRNSVLRIAFTAVLLALQVAWLLFMIVNLEDRWPWIGVVITYITLFVAMCIYCRDMNSAFRIAWMTLILSVPVLGLVLYVLIGRKDANRGMKKHFFEVERGMQDLLGQDMAVMEELEKKDPLLKNEFRYVWWAAGKPVYANTDVWYFPDAAEAFRVQLDALRNAKRFIFMEYYAIEDRESFGRVKQILHQKVKAGVEVRLFYDEIGSMHFLTDRFIRQMEALGVQCRVFNPVSPLLNLFMNNRDHRKIMVVDNELGFTGGYNLANEYFHITEPYGYWKDTGIMLRGDAVQSLTHQFLEMWNCMEKTDTDFLRYLVIPPYEAKGAAFVQPYSSTPLRRERVAEEVYMNILRSARRYVWFVTPYLVITDEMSREMTSAACRGIDVRILVPGIPDKKTVYMVTKSYFPQLIRGGVRIYLYTPGFCHAKMCVSDDEMSVVGTANLDYRSLYLHFENAVLVCDQAAARIIRRDFEEMLAASREVTPADMEGKPAPNQLAQAFLRFISPLL